MDLQKLLEPFDPADIEFRAGATNGDKTKALALPYLTARAVMDRLDQAVGPENWQDIYTAGPLGGVLCGISVHVGDAWITKFDGADNTDIESVKGGLSDAFKRAAVKWGIGRYLYGLPRVWVKAEPRGKSVTIDEDEARAKMFGQAPAVTAKAPPSFATLNDLLFQLHIDFGLAEAEAKARLKELGFHAWPKNGEARKRSTEMYLAVKKAVGK